MKSGKMMFPTFVLFISLTVIGECIKLPENHDMFQQLTDAIHRLEDNIAETQERAAKREAKRDEEMKKIIQENNYLHETIHRLEAKISATEERVADLSVAMHRLEAKFAESEIKKNEEVKQIKKENSEIIAELNDKVQKQVADTDLLNVQFTEFREQQGECHYNSICLSNN